MNSVNGELICVVSISPGIDMTATADTASTTRIFFGGTRANSPRPELPAAPLTETEPKKGWRPGSSFAI